jgi:hypothetical protein
MSKNTEQAQARAQPDAPTAAAPTSRTAKYALLALAGALFSLLVLNLHAGEALAQQGGGGGGDAIESTLTNVRDYIAGLLLVLGGIGFVVSLGLKAASPVNENAQYLAHMGLKSSAIAVLAGAIVAPIMDIIQGLAGG